MLPSEAFTVVRKSFDARKLLKEPQFIYSVDMDVKKILYLEPRAWDFISRLEPKIGAVEYMSCKKELPDIVSMLNYGNAENGMKKGEETDRILIKSLHNYVISKRPKVVVVGSGPSGLFAALVLGELGADVTLIERGQAVEQRGRDIGALVVRRALQVESNFCFGELGEEWLIDLLLSSAKFMEEVMFHSLGMLLGYCTWSDGKLVTRIGRNSDSVQAVDIKFGTRLDDLIVENKKIIGVKVSDAKDDLRSSSQKLLYDAVVLAVGHSARDVYEMLLRHNVELIPKDFAYSSLAGEVQLGRGKVPVADYKVVKYIFEGNEAAKSSLENRSRSCYSFCMCPGGQVVLTSTNPSELCINGMSFSRRSSRWANAAIVVTVSSKDFDSFRCYGPLCGVQFQRHYERKAAMMGGGNFVVPAQTVTDFLENKLSGLNIFQVFTKMLMLGSLRVSRFYI
ncbi:hypothetical protein AXF42_Ash001879 [Apostasia shenzhenica]|uniref:Uncharacterized protein n=1 Tax=Apostasia shenzhenica TaxID=1088818 RepID=A0A2I0ABG6_9ASPA|nr:hypothetical protein AXF42_Ash001879 [Apostasia shenzhenica]